MTQRRPLRLLLLSGFLRVAGVRRDAAASWGFRATWLFFAWIGAFVLFFGGSVFAFVFTSRPVFCSTCHNIRPYYESWKVSSHKDFSCVYCHFEPGTLNYLKRKFLAVSEVAQYVTRTYEPRPRSRTVDECCTRSECHPVEKLAQELTIKVDRPRKTTMEIKFNHAKHLTQIGDKKLRCVSCHLQVTQDVHFQIRAGVCFLCHLHGTTLNGANAPRLAGRDQACTVCHDAPVGAIRLATGTYDHAEFVGQGADCRSCHQDSIQGSGDVHIENCLHCHGNLADLAVRNDPTRIHAKHVAGHDAECFDCHFPIEHGLPAHRVTSVGQCSSCHESGHDLAVSMFAGTGGHGVPVMPSPMFRTHVDCQGCHHQDRIGVIPQGMTASEASCQACHGLKYEGRLFEWKRTTDQLIAEAEQLIGQAGRRSLELTGDGLAQSRSLLDEARYNVDFVRKARAAHNINYATALLNVSKAKAEEVLRMPGGS